MKKWQQLSTSLMTSVVATLGLFAQHNAFALPYETYLESWDARWKDAMKYLPPGPNFNASNSYAGVTLNIAFGCFSFPGLQGLQFTSADVDTVVKYVHSHGGLVRISFGGASYAAPCYPNYFISQTSGWPDNASTLAQGVLDVLSNNNLDGVDFDIEDPQPSNVTAQNFANEIITFLKLVRQGLPSGKTLSLTIPGQGWNSYWYYLARGVAAIPGLVDYINFMEEKHRRGDV